MGSYMPPATEGSRSSGPRRAARGPRLALAALAVAVLAWIGYQAATWPDVSRLAQENPRTTSFIERYKSAQQKKGQPASPAWTWVAYQRISPHLKRAVLVGEDINFFSHEGFDTEEIHKSLDEAWKKRKLPRGASTITQQVAKNLWLSPSRDPVRKVKELLLARALEKRLSKRRIFEIYLNVVEFGPGTYGAEAAARRYFGKSAASLEPNEAAQLAAGLPRPSAWHPGATSRSYRRRVATIQRRMEKAAFLWKQI